MVRQSAHNSSVQSSSIDQMYGYAAPVRSSSNTPSSRFFGCFNCNGTDHFCSQCEEPWCYVCNGDWTPPKSQFGRHRNTDCPQRKILSSSYAQKGNAQPAGQLLAETAPNRQFLQGLPWVNHLLILVGVRTFQDLFLFSGVGGFSLQVAFLCKVLVVQLLLQLPQIALWRIFL